MAVDPNTGQTVINQPGFDMRYAGFLDPNAVGNLQAGQNQAADQQGHSAQSHASEARLYAKLWRIRGDCTGIAVPGRDANAQEIAREHAGSLCCASGCGETKAALAKHAQDQADLDAAEKRDVLKATQTKEGETQIGLKYGDQLGQQAATAAAAKAQAELPSQMTLENQKGKFQLGAAEIAANAANRRGYVVSDASGNQHIITPSGQEIYTATSPGGGKLTAPQTALNEADVAALKNYTTRTAAAQQLSNNIPNFVAKYTGQDPQKVAQMTPQQQADLVRSVPTTSALAMAVNPNYGGLDAISSDIGINAAGTKRPDPDRFRHCCRAKEHTEPHEHAGKERHHSAESLQRYPESGQGTAISKK